MIRMRSLAASYEVTSRQLSLRSYQLAINTASGAVLGRRRCRSPSRSQDSVCGTAASRNHRPLSTELGNGDCWEASLSEGPGPPATSEGDLGIRVVALNEKDRRGGAVLGRWPLADRREPAERMLSIVCTLRDGNSTALLPLPVLLVDAPAERGRASLDFVSRFCGWRCFFVEVDSEVS